MYKNNISIIIVRDYDHAFQNMDIQNQLILFAFHARNEFLPLGDFSMLLA